MNSPVVRDAHVVHCKYCFENDCSNKEKFVDENNEEVFDDFMIDERHFLDAFD